MTRFPVDHESTEPEQVLEALHMVQFSTDHAGDQIFFVRPEGRIFYVNEQVCSRLGYSREELLAMHVWDVDRNYPPGKWPSHWEELKRQGTLRFESSQVRRDGSEFPTEITVRYLRYRDSEYACAFVRDMSESRRAQAELRRSEQRFRSIFDSVNDAIFVHDARDGRILDVNRRMCEMYGYTREEALRLDVAALSSGTAPHTNERALQRIRAAAAGEPQRFEWCARHKDGRLFWVDLSLRGASLAGEERILAVVRDVSERHRLEAELRQRTRELDQAARHKDLFLSVLSHELRNPLAPIHNALYILERADPAGDQARKAKALLQRQVGHLTRLVDELLDLTRIARGKIELRMSRVDLAELVRHTLEDNRSLIEQRRIRLAADLPPAPVWVQGDPTRLAQVTGNLVRNAIKFAPGAQLRVSLAAEGDAAELHVRDTGVGIEPALLERIFEPFAQAEQTRSRSEGGLGLGLALVKGLVELHGGRVAAASEGPGRGAEFCVRLPLAAAEPAVRPAPGTGAAPARTRHRVLVVDDNADAADSLADLIKLLGHDVEIAYDGASAIKKAREARPDVVLCDISLPGMSGYEVARALRAAAPEHMQLIALSGYAQPEDVKAALEAGFDRHMAKPPDPEEIERLLGEAKPAR